MLLTMSSRSLMKFFTSVPIAEPVALAASPASLVLLLNSFVVAVLFIRLLLSCVDATASEQGNSEARPML